MPKITLLRFALPVLLTMSMASVSSCTTAVRTTSASRPASKPLPPGQEKKISGEKSAKRYAPGQNK